MLFFIPSSCDVNPDGSQGKLSIWCTIALALIGGCSEKTQGADTADGFYNFELGKD